MTINTQQTVKAALSYIRSQQQENGSFLSDQGKPTTFYTSLVLSTISLEGALKDSAVQFILSELSADNTVNYWQRHSAEYSNAPYPDDIDDTFIAMQALYKADSKLITEDMLASLVSLLINQEVAPGGPYKTWIINSSDVAWQDIDIVANSNVAAFLQTLGVSLPQMQEYFETALVKPLSSKYYHDEITVLYFLSRAYQGNNKQNIINKILALRNSDGNWGNALHTAFSVSSLIRLGVSRETLTPAVQYIVQTETDGSWPSTALYVESIEDGIPTYSSCSAYTSVCCIEALRAYEPPPKSEDKEEEAYIHEVHEACLAVTNDPVIKQQLAGAIDALLIKDPSNEIALLSYNFSQQMVSNIPNKETVKDLAIANTLGWIGYSVYDSLLDGEDKVSLLPLANTCVKAMINTFKALARGAEYATVQRILEGIDSSTLWEHMNCKAGMEALPDYDDHMILAQKSLGHALGPILLLHTEPLQAILIEEFFVQYLIAKQLNDDAHDWQEDLENGWVNSASVGMIKKLQTMHLDTLQEYFWNQHIDTVAESIVLHCSNARDILKKVTALKDVTFLEQLIAPLEASARLALEERDKTQRFLKSMKY